MMNIDLKICTLFCSAVILFGTATAEAGGPYGGFGPGYYSAFGRYHVDQLPPYFAQFPPVYYKHPVIARHYGASPFAYPPCGCHPNVVVEEVEPEIIKNPYVKPKANKTKAKVRSTSGPMRIINPYVQRQSGDRLASDDSRVQTIYPAAIVRVE